MARLRGFAVPPLGLIGQVTQASTDGVSHARPLGIGGQLMAEAVRCDGMTMIGPKACRQPARFNGEVQGLFDLDDQGSIVSGRQFVFAEVPASAQPRIDFQRVRMDRGAWGATPTRWRGPA